MSQCTTIFDASNPDHRPTAGWRYPLAFTWEHNAKAHAKAYGEAKVWRADDSVVRYWLDNGKIRQRTYHKVIHTH
jgi:hypothetical protein